MAQPGAYRLADGSTPNFSPGKPDITPTDLAFDPSDGGVDFGYTIGGADLPRATTVALYWASGTTFDTKIDTENGGQPIYPPIITALAQGTYPTNGPIHVPQSALIDPPPGAKYLIVVPDPDNLLKMSYADTNTKALALPDLVIGFFDWDRTQGGVDLSYEVKYNSSPRPTDISLFWATGTTIDTKLGPAAKLIKINQGMDSYRVPHDLVDASAISLVPDGAKYLLAVIDFAGGKTGGLVVESDETNNLGYITLADILAPPTLALHQSPTSIGWLDNYHVYLDITNPMPIRMHEQITYKWSQLFPDITLRNGKHGAVGDIRSAEDQTFDGVVGFNEKQSVELGSFSNTWDWIDPPSPTMSQDFLKLFFEADKVSGITVDEAIGQVLEHLDFNVASKVYDAIGKVGDQVEKYVNKLKPRLGTDLNYYVDGVWKTTGEQVTAGPYDVAIVGVPKPRQDLYKQFVNEIVAAKGFLSKSIGAIADPSVALAFLTGGIALFIDAENAYRNVYDPADPEYTTLASAQPPDVPSVNALPEGTAKQVALTSLQLEAVLAAASVSRDRADGAQVAGQYAWQAKQLAAAAGWMNVASGLQIQLDGLYRKLEADPSLPAPQTGAQIMSTVQSEGGVPRSLLPLLSQMGLSTDQINALNQALLAASPGSFDAAGQSLGPELSRTFALADSGLANDDTVAAVNVNTMQLGQQPRSLTTAEQQELSALQSRVQDDLNLNAAPASLLADVESYQAEVQTLMIASASPEALADALTLSYTVMQQTEASTVAAAAPSGLTLTTISNQTLSTGENLILTATAADSNAGATIAYSLDPGATAGASIDSKTGAFRWNPSSPGTYAVTVRATDDSSPPLSDAQTFTITVNDVSPAISLGSNVSIPQGTNFTRTGAYSSPTAGTFTATVDYGDGTGLQPLALTPSETFTLSHAYARSGTFTVTVGVVDSFGVVGRQTLSVSVAPAPLVSGFGAGRDAFVTTLYRDVLGRYPEPAGLRYWSAKLASGAPRRAVASGIWRSSEHRTLVRQHLAPAITLRRSFLDSLRSSRQTGRVSQPARSPSAT